MEFSFGRFAQMTTRPLARQLKKSMPFPWTLSRRAKVSTVSVSPKRAARLALSVEWACSEAQVREAQKLRWDVFVEEMGAKLDTPEVGFDIDRFDAFCDHLLIRDELTQEVVGTYRVLLPHQAQRAGSLYSDQEFDLTRLAHLRPSMLELGRSCVHPEHRHGGVILALWGALADFMAVHQLDVMVGCASIPMRDGGHMAASLWRQLQKEHLSDPEWRVEPHLPLPLNRLNSEAAFETPALIKGYLRLGAKILGAPAWDPDFNTADLPMLMRVSDLPSRFRKNAHV